MSDADPKPLEALVSRVRKIRAEHPDDDYRLGKAAALEDPQLPGRLGYPDARAMWKAACPELDPDLLVEAAEAAPECTAAEFRKFGARKMWLYLQLVKEGVLARVTSGLGDLMFQVPVSMESEETHAQTFEYATEDELRLTLDWTRQHKPASQPPASQPPASQPPASQPPASQPPASQPPASQPPASQPPAPQPPAPQPPSPQPGTAPPSAPVPPTASPASRWLPYVVLVVVAVGVGYRVLASRSERFEEEHRSLGQLPDETRPAPSSAPPTINKPSPAATPHSRPSVVVPLTGAQPQAVPDAGRHLVEDEKNDMTPEQLEQEQRSLPPEQEWDPLKKVRR